MKTFFTARQTDPLHFPFHLVKTQTGGLVQTSGKMTWAGIMSDEEAMKLAKPVSPAEIDSVMNQAAEKTINHEFIYKLHARDFLD